MHLQMNETIHSDTQRDKHTVGLHFHCMHEVFFLLVIMYGTIILLYLEARLIHILEPIISTVGNSDTENVLILKY